MLHTTQQDRAKIDAQVEKLLTVPDTVRLVFVNEPNLYRQCRLERLPRVKFRTEVQDVLCGTGFAEQFGTWLYTEWEMHVCVFIRVKNAEETRRMTADGMIRNMVKTGEAVQHMGPFYDPNVEQPEEDENE